jgi:hypothetical protein
MRWLLLFVLLMVATAETRAATIQAMLIRASNEAPSDASLNQLHPHLKHQFGYQHYRLLGNKQDALKLKTARKLDVGEGFFVVATLRSSKKHVHEIDIEWTSGTTKLVSTTVKMSEGSQVFVKGPGVGNDWIVLALSVLR